MGKGISKKGKKNTTNRRRNNLSIGQCSTFKNYIIFKLLEDKSIGVKAILNKDGTIQVERISTTVESCNIESECFELNKNLSKYYKIFRMLFYISNLLIGFLLTHFWNLKMFSSAIILIIFDIVFDGNFTYYMFKVLVSCYVKEDYKVTKGLHSAEHMVSKAYNDLQRVPTLEEIRRYSKFLPTCSSVAEFKACFQFPVYLFLIGLQTLETPAILMLISFLISLLTCIPEVYQFFGWYRLRKPTDKELEVAIRGIEEYELLREDYLANKNKEL